MRAQFQEVAEATNHAADGVAAYLEALTGVALCSFHFWHTVLAAISDIAHAITAIGGAAITLHGIYRIFRHHYPKQPKS